MASGTEKIYEIAMATAPVVIVYFAGLVYLSFFLSAFSIGINEVIIPIQSVLAISFNVFWSIYFIRFLIAVFIIFVAFERLSKKYRDKLLVRNPIYVTFYVIFLMFVVFGIVSYSAKLVADDRAEMIWNGKSSKLFIDSTFSLTNYNLGNYQKSLLAKCFSKLNFIEVFSTYDVVISLCITDESKGLVFSYDRKLQRFDQIRFIANLSEGGDQ